MKLLKKSFLSKLKDDFLPVCTFLRARISTLYTEKDWKELFQEEDFEKILYRICEKSKIIFNKDYFIADIERKIRSRIIIDIEKILHFLDVNVYPEILFFVRYFDLLNLIVLILLVSSRNIEGRIIGNEKYFYDTGRYGLWSPRRLSVIQKLSEIDDLVKGTEFDSIWKESLECYRQMKNLDVFICRFELLFLRRFYREIFSKYNDLYKSFVKTRLILMLISLVFIRGLEESEIKAVFPIAEYREFESLFKEISEASDIEHALKIAVKNFLPRWKKVMGDILEREVTMFEIDRLMRNYIGKMAKSAVELRSFDMNFVNGFLFLKFIQSQMLIDLIEYKRLNLNTQPSFV